MKPFPRTPRVMQLHLEHHRPDRNCLRYYALGMDRDLFGTWVVTRRWGRIGRSERVRHESVGSAFEAEALIAQICRNKQRRGYVRLPEHLDLAL